MQYPLISEYVDAIRSAEYNFDKLSDLRPVLDGNGNPVMSSGNFAVVFKMKNANTNKLYAVKCFTKEQEGREEAYRQIADELEFVQSTYLAKVKYYDRELFVDTNSSDDNEFPVLLMDWVEGETLDKYIRQNINDTYALEMLAYNFSRLAIWLLPQPFAHGDLNPDNILVHDDGSLTLVDYDGMFVPAMQGQKSRELASPDFRHPLRTKNDFNEHIDDFPAMSVLLSLRLIASDPSLLYKYGMPDRLLFCESDYCDLSSCSLLKEVFPSQNFDINTLVSLFTISCAHKNLVNVSTRLLAIEKPKKLVEEKLSTKVTDKNLKNAIADEFGAKYSPDGKRLLKGVDIKEYKIKDGTKIICDSAFVGCRSLEQITIPLSVTCIGDCAFGHCRSLHKIIIPVLVNKIGTNPFISCKCKIICKSPKFKIVDNVLYNVDMTTLIAFLSDEKSFTIPSSVTSVGDSVFCCCESLQQITIPSSVTSIGNSAFSFCSSLQQITIPLSVTSIGDRAFSWCKSLQQITIPVSVKKIGANPFTDCECEIICESSDFKVVDNVLYNADMTTLIAFLSDCMAFTVPSSVTSIGDSAFEGCRSLEQITIPSSVTSIGDSVFCCCESLQQITIPSSVTSIGNCAFLACISLEQITIPSGVTSIGVRAFFCCYSLRQITIPSSVTSIGFNAFCSCNSLEQITISSSVASIDDRAFDGCKSLHVIYIPRGSKDRYAKLLPEMEHLFVEEYKDYDDDLPF